MCANLDPAFRDIFPVKPHTEKHRLELLEDACVNVRYSLKCRISREDLEVRAQRIAVLRERPPSAPRPASTSPGRPPG